MRPRLKATHLVLPLYAVAAILLTWPLALHLTTSIASFRVGFDPIFQAQLIAWDWRTLPHGLAAMFDLPIFHPEPLALTYMDHMLGESLLGAPALAATGSVAAAYNVNFLLTFVLSGWAVYRLVRLFGVPRAASWLCGFLFAFSPYRYANLDVLNQLHTELLPLGLFFALRYLSRWALRDAVGVAAALAAQAYFGWYYASYLLVALGLLGAFAVASRAWRPPPGHGVRLLVLGAAAAAVAFPVAWPYIAQRFAMPDFRRTLGEAALYSADVIDYLKSSATSMAAQALGLPTGEQSYWPGFVAVVGACFGAADLIRRWRAGRAGSLPPDAGSARRPASAPGARSAGAARLEPYFPWLAVSSFVFSLGPILHVAGHRIWIPLPYGALYFIVPGISSTRAPARMASLTLLAVVVLAGFGFRHLEQRFGRSHPRRFRLAFGALALAAVLFALPRPLSLLELPTEGTLSPAYRWLAHTPGSEPVLDVPVPIGKADGGEVNALRQYSMLFVGRPRVDGCSGFVSRRYLAFRDTARAFPEDSALDAMRRMGAGILIVHYGDYAPEESARVARLVSGQPRIQQVARFGPDVAYRLLR